MNIVNVRNEFHHRLANRDNHQGDGTYTAKEFRVKYLSELDTKEAWENDEPFITLNFEGVKKIGPSFANEAFAYFTKYNVKPNKILKKILFTNISKIQLMIITEELNDGYKTK